MTAAKAFKAIDSPTQAVIVPSARPERSWWPTSRCLRRGLEIDLLRTAQQYSVNVFPHVRKLQEAQALVRSQTRHTRILCLDGRYCATSEPS